MSPFTFHLCSRLQRYSIHLANYSYAIDFPLLWNSSLQLSVDVDVDVIQRMDGKRYGDVEEAVDGNVERLKMDLYILLRPSINTKRDNSLLFLDEEKLEPSLLLREQ